MILNIILLPIAQFVRDKSPAIFNSAGFFFVFCSLFNWLCNLVSHCHKGLLYVAHRQKSKRLISIKVPNIKDNTSEVKKIKFCQSPSTTAMFALWKIRSSWAIGRSCEKHFQVTTSLMSKGPRSVDHPFQKKERKTWREVASHSWSRVKSRGGGGWENQ